MREVGIIIWVVFIVIGVIANIASTVRKQQAASGVPSRIPRLVQPPQARPAAQPASPAPVRRPKPPPAPVTPKPAAPQEAASRRPRPLFAGGPSLVRAVIAAEVLGKPRALRDE